MTHTYALLEVSPTAHEEIAIKLRAAGYDHAFGADGEIDMHGIALVRAPATEADLRADAADLDGFMNTLAPHIDEKANAGS